MNFLDLDPKLQQELVEAFSKRFTNTIARGRLLDEARIPWPKQTENSWQNIFFCLANNPILLKKLLHTATQMYPEDHNLRDIVSLLAPDPKFHRRLGQSIAVLAGAVLALLTYAQFDQNFSTILPVDLQHSSALTGMLSEAPLKDFSRPLPREKEEIQAAVEAAEAILKPKTHLPDKQTAKRALIGSTSNSTHKKTTPPPQDKGTKRCRLEGNGELIGYWYAGSHPPEAEDGWVTMTHGINVRLDYPDTHNNYNARAPITCVLFRKTKVPLNQPAIHVPGGKYWVPLYSNPQG